ncbi:Leucine rich repeat-containing protein [Rubritalea squalenifaciens DSM 18772]|uniref:Leucine rich repeat-containing protein n=1 Tax=Rubritalea squalenifaciens DSM 18772 TaxID=1123071 RepID=A0A1M6PJ08_9BACT|nr:leucine-rich repeat domain-containing protein [Rubritalea squalenifaciens]SHK07929.1 Leucine rich repeat-containing protein [Rubritalea squalenifaciens DSM 18772]
MNHRSLHITRLLLTLFTALSLHASAGTLGFLTYEIVNGTSVTITDCDEAATGTIVIPETIESLPVTSVDGRTFKGCSLITSISYPSQIQYPPYHYIGCNSLEAFHVAESNTAITSVDGILFSADMTKIIRYPNARSTTTDYAIPDGVTSFYPYTFLECTGLNSVTIPASLSADTGSESVQQVILSVFKDTSNLQAVHVEEGNLALSSSNGVVFTQNGSGLLFYPPAKPSTSYTTPDGTTYINTLAFNLCTTIEFINIPDSVTSIADNAFTGCTNLSEFNIHPDNTIYSSSNGVLFENDGNTLYICPQGKVGTYTIPQNTTTLSTYAFSGCEKLTEINIPSSVTNIDYRSFTECFNLQALNVAPSNAVYSSIDGVLFVTDGDILFNFPRGRAGNYTIPHGTQTIGIYAFAQCINLTQVTIPSSVDWIRYGAFRYCRNLSGIHFSEGLQYIDLYAFLHCDNLTKVILPSTFIGGKIFIGSFFTYCDNLKSVTLSPNFTTVYSNFLQGCENLEEVIIPEGVTSIETNIFSFGKTPSRLILPSTIQQISEFRSNLLNELYLLGNAPLVNETNSPFSSDITIYYLKGATGFDAAPWTDYNLVEIDTSTYPNAAWLLENQQDHTLSLNEDPNGDDVPLLMEYALDLKAYQNNAPNLPQMEIGETTAGITFQGDTPGINYEVWTSTDLSNWTQTGVSLSTPDANGKRTATIPHSASSKAFLQLRVSQ